MSKRDERDSGDVFLPRKTQRSLAPRHLHADRDLLSSDDLERLDAQSDPLINLVAHIEEHRADGPAFEDPRFVEWLSRETRATRGGARDALSSEAVRGLASRILARAHAERLSVRGIDHSAGIFHDGPPAPVSQLVEESRNSDRAGALDLAVAAGAGRELWDETVDTWVKLPPDVPKGRYLALTVSGESMRPLLHTGDVVLVRLGSEVKTDTVIVALVPDGGYVVKRVGRVTSRNIELLSLNPEYPPLRIAREKSSVLGTVVLRWCDHEAERG